MRRGLGLIALLVLALGGCGEDGSAKPGYLSPCDTPMAPILDCPVSIGPVQPERTPEAACEYLVSCGILAAEQIQNNNHRLDYRWCVERLLNPGDVRDRCDDRDHSQEEADLAIDCIVTTPCAALGLRLGDKGNSDFEQDSYTCENGNGYRSATICDGGILNY